MFPLDMWTTYNPCSIAACSKAKGYYQTPFSLSASPIIVQLGPLL